MTQKPLDLEDIVKEWNELEKKMRKNALNLSKRMGQTITVYKPALEKEKLNIVKQHIKSAVQGLLEEIESKIEEAKTDIEIEQKEEDFDMVEMYKGRKKAFEEAIELIKKWFPDVVEEGKK